MDYIYHFAGVFPLLSVQYKYGYSLYPRAPISFVMRIYRRRLTKRILQKCAAMYALIHGVPTAF